MDKDSRKLSRRDKKVKRSPNPRRGVKKSITEN